MGTESLKIRVIEGLTEFQTRLRANLHHNEADRIGLAIDLLGTKKILPGDGAKVAGLIQIIYQELPDVWEIAAVAFKSLAVLMNAAGHRHC